MNMNARLFLFAGMLLLFGRPVIAQVTENFVDPTAPKLPHEEDTQEPRFLPGTTGFGANPEIVGAIHSEQIPIPEGEIINPPSGPPRIYLTIRYYACRPWFRHPYTGAAILRHELVRSVWTNCPAWLQLAQDDNGNLLPLEELLKPIPELGDEPLVSIEDDGLVHEGNPAAVNEFFEELNAEVFRATELAEALQEPRFAIPPHLVPSHIIHAPYYGLYCLRVRLCIPCAAVTPGTVYRYFVRFPYRLHQRWCWSRWWWHCWTLRNDVPVILPWRPLSVPHMFVTRAGPDWVLHLTNPNRYRHWCLFGLRYYCNFFHPVFRPRIVGIRDLYDEPDDSTTTGWIRPWPYPRYRYWPYGPYCTRWFWFRPIPWLTYRYFPPVIHCAFARPKAQYGEGFIPGPDIDPERNPDDPTFGFPTNPPTIDAEGKHDSGHAVDSFFDIFYDIAGASSIRPLEQQVGDNDGDGVLTTGDFNRTIRGQAGFSPPEDLEDMDSLNVNEN